MNEHYRDDEATMIHSDLDIVKARSLARDIARRAGFGAVEQARIATLVSDLAKKIFLHTGSGNVVTRVIENNGNRGVEIEIKNHETYGTRANELGKQHRLPSHTMNIEPSGNNRLIEDFEIESHNEMETLIVCRKWHR